jgi:Arc/MetJ-type ribon-helix-helix transcriptional regulator
MTMDNTVCVRLTDEEKKELQKYGSLSKVLREAMKFYLNNMKSQEILTKLEELQAKNPVKTSREEIIRMIREDRNRW